MVIAAYDASLIAHSFVFLWSWICSFEIGSTLPVAMFNPCGSDSLAVIIFGTNSLALIPAFSARILGKISNALAYLL
jgi:hypothetical protein